MKTYPRKSALRSAWLAGATSLVLFCGAFNSAWAQQSAAPKETETVVIENSKLNAEWMLLILLGEMQVTQGNPGAGYSMIFEAARKSGDVGRRHAAASADPLAAGRELVEHVAQPCDVGTASGLGP